MYSILRPLLFSLDPEVAHNITIHSLPWLQRLNLLKLLVPQRLEYNKTIMGLRFPNPVGLAAGLDKNGIAIEAFGALGFGFIEVGTVTPRPQLGNTPPRMFRLPAAQALINRMGFNNDGVAALVKRLQQVHFNGIIGVNIGKNRDTPVENAISDYLICLKAVYPYADYIVVNISSPNTLHLRNLQFGDAFSKLLAILKIEQQHLKTEFGRFVPLAVKLAPDLTDDQIINCANIILAEGIDGVIATNTTIARESVTHLLHGNEEGGLSGLPLNDLSNSVIAKLFNVLNQRVPIIGCGGIMTAQDATAKRAAGAALIQLYTGLIYRGPHLINECVSAFIK